MEFSRQKHWSGQSFPFPGIFPAQGSKPGLPHCRQILYCLNHQGSQVGAPKMPESENAIICPSTAMLRASGLPSTARGLPPAASTRPGRAEPGCRQDVLTHPSGCHLPPPRSSQLLRAEVGGRARRAPSQATDFRLQAFMPGSCLGSLAGQAPSCSQSRAALLGFPSAAMTGSPRPPQPSGSFLCFPQAKPENEK